MSGLAVFLVIIGCVFIVLGCLNQRSLWWSTAAWEYRNPDAAEPSDAMFALSRVSMFVVGAACLLFALAVRGDGGESGGGASRDDIWATTPYTFVAPTVTLSAPRDLGGDEVYQVGNRALSSLMSESYPYIARYPDIVDREGGGNVKVKDVSSERGRQGRTAKYELTNRKGKYPVCVILEEATNPGLSQIADHDIKEGRC